MPATFGNAEKKGKRDFLKVSNPWGFDDGFWVDPDLVNENFRLIDLDGVDISEVRTSLLAPHVIGAEALDFDEIDFDDEQKQIGWRPGVKPGRYSVKGSDSELLARNSLYLPCGASLTEEGLSVIQLPTSATPNSGIFAEELYRDGASLEARQLKSYNLVVQFTGLGANGKELDTTESASNIDDEYDEFMVGQVISQKIEGEVLHTPSVTGSLYTFEIGESPTLSAPVDLSRRDIFKNEMWISSFNDGLFAGTLEDGDYTVSYGEAGGTPSITVYLSAERNDYGTASYYTWTGNQVLFNKEVVSERSQTIVGVGLRYITLDYFPVLDETSIDEADGSVRLDADSLVLEVDGAPWARVLDLTLEADDATSFELNPALGLITFGAGGTGGIGGARPDGEVTVTYKSVPIVYTNTSYSDELFFDKETDIDPKLFADRGKFLCLDSRLLTADSIVLTTDEEYDVIDGVRVHGPLSAVLLSGEDIADLTARVITSGTSVVGVPDVPVRFESDNGVTRFSQSVAVTDSEGYARTRVYGAGHFRNYALSVEMYRPLDAGAADYLQPDPGSLTPFTPAWGAHFLNDTTIVVPEVMDYTDTDIYMLINSMPSEEGDGTEYSGTPADEADVPTPYNGVTRQRGISVAFYANDGNSNYIVKPTTLSPGPMAGTTAIEFPVAIPRGHLITSYKIVSDRRSLITASLLDRPDIRSNDLVVGYTLDETYTGQWTLPRPPLGETDGVTEPVIEDGDYVSSRISTGVFIQPNSVFVKGIRNPGGLFGLLEVTVGQDYEVYGTDIPTQADLELSVFIIKTDSDDEVIAVKNITSSTSQNPIGFIEITSLPEPPTEEYDVSYWIALGGFDTLSENRKTARQVIFRS